MSYVKAIYFDLSLCCDDFVKGIESLEQCLVEDSVVHFKSACNSVSVRDQFFPKYKSYYGLSSLLSGDESGMTVCRNIVKTSPFDADVHLNLARAEMFMTNRKAALEVIDQGLGFASRHPGLNDLKIRLGVRGMKYVPFLSRNHCLNIALGKLLRRKK